MADAVPQRLHGLYRLPDSFQACSLRDDEVKHLILFIEARRVSGTHMHCLPFETGLQFIRGLLGPFCAGLFDHRQFESRSHELRLAHRPESDG